MQYPAPRERSSRAAAQPKAQQHQQQSQQQVPEERLGGAEAHSSLPAFPLVNSVCSPMNWEKHPFTCQANVNDICYISHVARSYTCQACLPSHLVPCLLACLQLLRWLLQVCFDEMRTKRESESVCFGVCVSQRVWSCNFLHAKCQLSAI